MFLILLFSVWQISKIFSNSLKFLLWLFHKVIVIFTIKLQLSRCRVFSELSKIFLINYRQGFIVDAYFLQLFYGFLKLTLSPCKKLKHIGVEKVGSFCNFLAKIIKKFSPKFNKFILCISLNNQIITATFFEDIGGT